MKTDHIPHPDINFAPSVPRRHMLAWLLASATLVGLGACGGGGDATPATSWSAAAAAAPQDWMEPIPLPGRTQPVAVTLQDQTVRMPVRVQANGDAVRIKLSNVTGQVAVTVAAASVARTVSSVTGAVEAATLQPLRFSGATSVTIPAGGEVASDAAEMNIAAGTDLTVSLYFQAATPTTTVHRSTFRTAQLVAGNATASATLTGASAIARYHLLAGVDVRSADARTVVAAFGDSITDGTNSTIDALQRYPDHLAARIAANATAAGKVSVVNVGIAGNRVLNDKLGPKGVARFERDVLGQAGVTHTLILLGINDIGFTVFSGSPFNLVPISETVSATQIILGYQQMIDAARAKNVKVILGTLLPFRGAAYFNDANEAKRTDVNTWIRAQASKVGGIVDFDAAMGNPTDGLALNPAYDSGDHLHPNDVGYAAMAAAVNLALLMP